VCKGFYLAATDVGARRKVLVASVDQPFPMIDGAEIMNRLMSPSLPLLAETDGVLESFCERIGAQLKVAPDLLPTQE